MFVFGGCGGGGAVFAFGAGRGGEGRVTLRAGGGVAGRRVERALGFFSSAEAVGVAFWRNAGAFAVAGGLAAAVGGDFVGRSFGDVGEAVGRAAALTGCGDGRSN